MQYYQQLATTQPFITTTIFLGNKVLIENADKILGYSNIKDTVLCESVC
jgi:hypothetical protein